MKLLKETKEFYQEVIYVNADIARKFLDCVDKQRSEKPGKITQWSRLMVADKWYDELNDPIRFDAAGRFRDGQNRMRALLEAAKTRPDISIRFVVQYNVSEDALKHVDTGTARSFADILSMNGRSNANVLERVTRRVYLWDQGEYAHGGGAGANAKIVPTHSELFEFLEANPNLAYSAARGKDVHLFSKKIITPSTAGVAHHVLYRLDDRFADMFADMLMTGADSDKVLLDSDHPVEALRRRLQYAKQYKIYLTVGEILALCCRAWNHMTAVPMVRITGNLPVVRTGKLNNENFPLPKKPKSLNLDDLSKS